MRLSHSFWKIVIIFGMLLACTGRGLVTWLIFTSTKSSILSGWLVMGQQPVASIYFSMMRFSKICPVNLETTGFSMGSPVSAQKFQDIKDI